MTKTPLALALAASAAIAALPTLAAAQPYGSPSSHDQYQQQQDDYQQRLQQYNQQRAAYDSQRSGSGYRSRDDRSRAPCADRSSDRAATGGIIGALAGAAIGSNVAGRGSHTEGAVLGAVAGGVVGAGIASSSARCDGGGYYYSYNQTRPYRESSDYRGQRSGQYDYSHYRSNGCRLVIAPARWNGGEETRYARACPDSYGRYRLTE